MVRVADFLEGKAVVMEASVAFSLKDFLPSEKNVPNVPSKPVEGAMSLFSSSPTNWSALFKANQLKFCQPKLPDCKKSVFIPKSIHDQGIEVWNDSRIGKFMVIHLVMLKFLIL